MRGKWIFAHYTVNYWLICPFCSPKLAEYKLSVKSINSNQVNACKARQKFSNMVGRGGDQQLYGGRLRIFLMGGQGSDRGPPSPSMLGNPGGWGW